MDKIYNSEKELLNTMEKALKKPFREYPDLRRLYSKKGGVGQFVEEQIFGRACNSESEPDIKELGIEIKTSPFKFKKNGDIAPKERLALGLINYMTEDLNNFYQSHFWYKNQKLLIGFYHHNNDTAKENWFLDRYLFFQWPEEDLEIVKKDWEKIVGKIANGKAHEISERDTIYLSACTKGKTATESVRQQPFSDILAKQRAYALKNKYISVLLHDYVYGKKENEKIIKNVNELKEKSLTEYISDQFAPYIGKTQQELVEELNVPKSKQINNSIIKRILGLNNDADKTEEFRKAGIVSKTVMINHDNSIKESMSFPHFCFSDIIEEEDFYESDIYDMFGETIFMFLFFKKENKGDRDNEAIFQGVNFFSLPEEDLEEIEKVYNQLRETIISGVELKKVPFGNGFRIENNLPKKSENTVAHIRPHTSQVRYKFDGIDIGKDTDGDVLPDGRIITKQCFWLNNTYIRSIYLEWMKKNFEKENNE